MDMNNELMIVNYEVNGQPIKFAADDVRKWMVKGTSQFTDQEIVSFMQLCKYQKLNPWTGEAYAIKFKDECQLVVGFKAYERRADDNPYYRGRKSGIVVRRGNDIVKKEGTCLYPTEELLGGWCKVYRSRGGEIEEMYKEVSFAEYDKGFANWKSKPATMIDKVAVSQALRAAFPKDYEGLYTEEELSPTGEIHTGISEITPEEKKNHDESKGNISDAEFFEVDDSPVTDDERKEFFRYVHDHFGKEEGNDLVMSLLSENGLKSTINIHRKTFNKIYGKVKEVVDGIEGEEFPVDSEEKAADEVSTIPNDIKE